MSPQKPVSDSSSDDTSSSEAQAQPSQHTPFSKHGLTPTQLEASLLEQDTGDVASAEAQAQPMEHLPAMQQERQREELDSVAAFLVEKKTK
jgi:hypothetical protein